MTNEELSEAQQRKVAFKVGYDVDDARRRALGALQHFKPFSQ